MRDVININIMKTGRAINLIDGSARVNS